jgi:hypothetical protein
MPTNPLALSPAALPTVASSPRRARSARAPLTASPWSAAALGIVAMAATVALWGWAWT